MRKLKNIFTTLILTASLTLIASCYSPNPLYGTWTDNNGNKIIFRQDLTYSANITYRGTSTEYEGSISVIENVLSISKASGEISNTEWDIRGGILYLTWTTNLGESVALQLYHTAK